MNDAVRAAAALLARRAGLALDAAGEARLRGALEARAAELGASAAEVAARAAREPELLEALVDGATLQETSFFRDPQVFAALAREVLAEAPEPLVLWSAGCAHGQEAYTLAMLLAELGRDGLVLATDTSAAAVARARDGVYAERELRGLSDARCARFLRPAGDGRFAVVPAVRERVRVLHHDLVRDPVPPAAAGAAAILCRNVLIYLAPEAAAAVVGRLVGALAPDGVLVAGSAESLWHLDADVRSVRLGRGFAYTRPGAEVPEEGAPAAEGTRAAPAGPSAASSTTGAPSPPAVPLPDAAGLRAEAAAALAAGAHEAAITLARRATYLDPDAPEGHLLLARALEAAGLPGAGRARRAAAAARAR